MGVTLALAAAAHHVPQPPTADSVPKGLLGAAIMITVIFAAIATVKARSDVSRGRR